MRHLLGVDAFLARFVDEIRLLVNEHFYVNVIFK